MRLFRAVLLSVLLTFDPSAFAAAAELVIGQINSPSSPTVGESAAAMLVGAQVAAQRINQSAGVKGMRVRLEHADDQFDADRAVALALEMITIRGASVLINMIGTAGITLTVAGALEPYGAALIGPMGSDQALSQPGIFPIRARFSDEIARLANQIHSVNGKVGVLYFKSGAGPKLADETVKALQKIGTSATFEAGFDVDKDINKMRRAIRPLIMQLKASGANGVVIVAGGLPFDAALLEIRQTLGAGFSVYGMSMVVWESLLGHVGDKIANGLVLTQGVMYPFPNGVSAVKPIVLEFRDDMMKLAPKQALSYQVFEGYLAVRIAVLAAERSKTLDPKAIRASLESMGAFDLGGLELMYTKSDRRGMRRADLTMIVNGRLVH